MLGQLKILSPLSLLRFFVKCCRIFKLGLLSFVRLAEVNKSVEFIAPSKPGTKNIVSRLCLSLVLLGVFY